MSMQIADSKKKFERKFFAVTISFYIYVLIIIKSLFQEACG